MTQIEASGHQIHPYLQGVWLRSRPRSGHARNMNKYVNKYMKKYMKYVSSYIFSYFPIDPLKACINTIFFATHAWTPMDKKKTASVAPWGRNICLFVCFVFVCLQNDELVF